MDVKREILFRGKTECSNDWLFGSLVLWGDDSTTIFTAVNGDFAAACLKYVLSETICQYTGLDDSKGNKIFEGDIICFLKPEDEEANYIVEWYNGGFVYRDVKIRALGSDLTQLECNRAKVIGNIYDNPELARNKK